MIEKPKNKYIFSFFFPWKKTERDGRRWKFSLYLTHSKTLTFSYSKREACNFNLVKIVCLDLSKKTWAFTFLAGTKQTGKWASLLQP